jgi:hypothetical protein
VQSRATQTRSSVESFGSRSPRTDERRIGAIELRALRKVFLTESARPSFGANDAPQRHQQLRRRRLPRRLRRCN